MKKTLKTVLIIMLLISTLIVLTGCGNDEKTSTKSNNKNNIQENENTTNGQNSATVQEALEEILASVAYFFNNSDIETVENYVDYNAATAYYLANSYEEVEGEKLDFHTLYNLINYIDQYGISDAFNEYEDFITELNGESEEDLNDIISARDKMKSYFEECVEHYDNSEEVNFEITSVSDLEQLESNIYSVDIEYNYSGIFDGEEDSGEESDTIYFIEIEGEYYIIYSEDFNID